MPEANRPQPLDRLRKRGPLTKTVEIYTDEEAADALERGQKELQDLPFTDAKRDVVQAQIDEARQRLEDSRVEIVLQGMGRKKWEALMSAHPITDEQRKEIEDGGDSAPAYDPDTFPVAAIAASILKPDGLTADDVQQFWDEWTMAESLELWMNCLWVNTQRRVVDLGKDSGPTSG